MKALIKVAICGMLAMAVHANAAVLASNAAEALREFEFTQQFLTDVLHVSKTATQAELAAKVGSITDVGQKAAVIDAINAYAQGFIKPTSKTDAVARLQDQNLAKLAFRGSNGQLVQIGAYITSATRQDGVNGAIQDVCSNANEAKALAAAAEGALTESEIMSVLDKGALKDASCGKPGGLAGFKAKAIVNAVHVAEEYVACGVPTDLVARASCLKAGIAKRMGIADEATQSDILGVVDGDCKLWANAPATN